MDIYIARQPILDLENNIFGYELLYRSNKTFNAFDGTDGDEATANVITNAFFDMHMKSIIGQKKAFINFTANLIKRGIPKMIPPEMIVVEILENIIIDEDILDSIMELKDLGYTIALDDFAFKTNLRDIFELGDIIKIDFRDTKESIEETSYICRYSNKVMLAEKVETYEEVAYAKSIGCVYMQGYYYSKPLLITRQTTTPLTHSFMSLLHLVSVQEPDIEAITDVISRDAALTQRLLRLINSVYFGFNSKVANVPQALMLLGLEHLREWIYLMGLRRVYGRDNIRVLEMALFRAKFCERIGQLFQLDKNRVRELYLMGLISVISDGDDVDMGVLDEFPVTDEIKNGIRKKGGFFSDVFKLTEDYERGRWREVDDFVSRYDIDKSDVSIAYIKSIEAAKSLDMYYN